MKKIIIAALLLLPITTNAYFDSSLKLGMTGQGVTELQEFLISEDCLTVNPTGYFGFLTLKSVKCFQSKYGITPVSGFFGSLSRAKANEIVAKEVEASKVEEVKEIGAAPVVEATPVQPTVISTTSPSVEATSTPEVKNTKLVITNLSWSPVGEPYGFLTYSFREVNSDGTFVKTPKADVKIYNTADNETIFEMAAVIGKDSKIRCNTREFAEYGITYEPFALCTFEYSAPFHVKEGAYILEVTNGKSVDRRSFRVYAPSL